MIIIPRQTPTFLGGHYGHAHTHTIDRPIRPSKHRSSTRSLPLIRRAKPQKLAMPCLLDRLPHELQKLVFSHLDYQSLILLSTTNRHFHNIVKPRQMSDMTDRFQFVMRAAKDFAQHRPCAKGKNHLPGNYECYICCRVRAPNHFDVLQVPTAYVDPQGHVVSDREPGSSDHLVKLRRFCIECGIEHGLHVPSDSLTTKTGQDLWVCECRQVWQKPGCLRCPNCGVSCPLRPRKKW